MQWTFNREMQEYESETRGPWQGVIRVIGPRFHAGVRHAATMTVEDGPRFDDLTAAQAWVATELLTRGPVVAAAPPTVPLPRGSVLPAASPIMLPPVGSVCYPGGRAGIVGRR
jgi:hypothetical protein